jgi:hypothetical protein
MDRSLVKAAVALDDDLPGPPESARTLAFHETTSARR